MKLTILKTLSDGPKNYSYCTKNGKRCVKVKGFSLNSQNAPVLGAKNGNAGE
jgi:hypothetical protein